MNLNEYRKTFLKPVNRNLKFRETLDTLEQDNEFQKRAERFLTSVGENSDDIFEYLRDSDYNLYNGFKRASESKLFTPQQKADYRYLRQRFDRADTGSLKQYLGAAKDIGIDLVTDPTLLTAVITSPVTGGATLATRAALAKGASTGLKQLAKNQTNKAIAVTAAEAGGWTGLDNYFRQETEVNTGIRKLFSTPELVGSTALGTLMGGLLGAGAQKLAIVHSKKASEFTDDEYLEQVGSMAAYRLGTRKDKIIARTIGKPTAILNTMAQFSPIADSLRKLIRYDAGKEFFNRTNKPLEFSFGENINWRTGNYKLMYEQAISPLYTKQNGIMTDEQQKNIIRLLRGGPKEGATMAEIVVANNLKKFYDTIFNHAVKNKLISPRRRVKNYFPISWNRKAIKENPQKFRELLLKEDGVSSDNVDEIIAGVLDEKNAAYGETANILTGMRGLNIKDENVFEDFLINDLHAVSHSYYAKAARNIETKKAFGLRDKNTGELKLTRDSALEEFEKQWVDPLNQELIAKGVKGGLTKTERNNIVNLFKTLTGDLDYYKSDVGQGIYDALKLSQQVAHLPLATLSSMSEVFIPLTKGKPERYTQELLKSIGEAGELFTKKIPRILKDKHNLDQPEVFNEMNKVFLAVEEALADRVENLAGEGMQTEWVKKGARGFFKANLLTQWTRLVQLASFNIGKDLISSNLKALHKASKAGTDIYKATGKLRRYKEELFDLGIDIEQGIKWVDDGAKQADALKDYSELTDSEKFYQVNLIRGAGRFVNEVILNPAREQAIKPIIQSNPKVDILFQFLGYPTAFSNTVLKNYARQVILNPAANAPKILGATVLMTGTALGLNYVRGSDESREEYFKDPQKTIQKAIQRVGLLGPLEHGVRFSDSLEYSKNPALSLLTLGGPILDDTLGSVFYRRGLSETLAKNIPGYASKNVLENLTGLTPYDNITEGARELDKSLKESMFGKPAGRSRYERDYQRSYRRNYQEGGLVSDMLFEDDMIDPYTTQIDKDNPVLNVADDPTKRTNPYTGTSYSEGTRPSVVATLQRRRRFAVGSLVAKGATKLLNTLSKKEQQSFMKNIVDSALKEKKPIIDEDLKNLKKNIVNLGKSEYDTPEQYKLMDEQDELFKKLQEEGDFYKVNFDYDEGKFLKTNEIQKKPYLFTDIEQLDFKLNPSKFTDMESYSQMVNFLNKNMLEEMPSMRGNIDPIIELAEKTSNKKDINILNSIKKNKMFYADSPKFDASDFYFTKELGNVAKKLFDNPFADKPRARATKTGKRLLPFDRLAQLDRETPTLTIGSEKNPLFVNPKKLDELINYSTMGEDYFRYQLRENRKDYIGKKLDTRPPYEDSGIWSTGSLNSLRNLIVRDGYKSYPIFVRVTRYGLVLPEGNHRLAIALISGQKEIPIELTYLNGSERLKNALSPIQLSKIIDTGKTGYKTPEQIKKFNKEVTNNLKKLGPFTEEFVRKQGYRRGGLVNRLQQRNMHG